MHYKGEASLDVLLVLPTASHPLPTEMAVDAAELVKDINRDIA